MARLRCTSCGRQFDRTLRSDFKCPDCAGLALFDWSEGGEQAEKGGGSARRLGQALRRRLRRADG